MQLFRHQIKLFFIVIGILLMVVTMLFVAGCDKTPASNQKTDAPDPEITPLPTPVREFNDQLPVVEGKSNQHVTMTIDNEGYDIFAPFPGQWGYRYGPSIIYYPDGSIDAWFATPGTTGEWDWFTYKHSDDGGKTWSYEKVVLQPTGDSYDHYSVCDPGVIFFNDYYYIGYTSTIVSTNGGINNNIFVARSKNPDGPYEKWNGNGWGGDPAPIIYFNESDSAWGAGEPSFVVLEDTLYMYYTWTCLDGNYTMVATANKNDENWPGKLEEKGLAYVKTGAQDSCDVVYIEDIGKFVAFSTYDRFTANSGIAIFESNDGITFKRSDVIRTGTMQFLHNMGISKRCNGHIQLDDELCFVGYAYSDGSDNNWGKWATRFQDVTIKYYEADKASSQDRDGKGTPHSNYFWDKPAQWTPISVGLANRFVQLSNGQSKDLKCYWYDTALSKHEVTDLSLVSFSEYDTSIVKIEGNKITALKEGRTYAKMMYGDDLYTYITIQVYDPSFDFESPATSIVEFRPVQDNITIYKNKVNGAVHKVQIRGFVVFNNGSWGEAYNDYTRLHPNYPAMVPAEQFEMDFESMDTNIVRVTSEGILTAKSEGTTKVRVTITGGHSFEVTVTVKNSPEA